MQGHAQSNDTALQELSDSDTVSMRKPWYASPGKYPKNYISHETWKGSYLEFAANNRCYLVKRSANDRARISSSFVSGDYLFDYSRKLLYLKFTDSTGLKSYEMVFKVAYLKEKRKMIVIDRKSAIFSLEKVKSVFVYHEEIPKLPGRARKNLLHWDGVLNMYRYVGATWDIPIAEILKCETVNSGITYVQQPHGRQTGTAKSVHPQLSDETIKTIYKTQGDTLDFHRLIDSLAIVWDEEWKGKQNRRRRNTLYKITLSFKDNRITNNIAGTKIYSILDHKPSDLVTHILWNPRIGIADDGLMLVGQRDYSAPWNDIMSDTYVLDYYFIDFSKNVTLVKSVHVNTRPRIIPFGIIDFDPEEMIYNYPDSLTADLGL